MQFRVPGFDSMQMRKLSPEEATEFAARVAELAKAGLPLGAGLRALADELSGWRLPHVLRKIADRLDAGDDLIRTLESQGSLPNHLRGLMLAGVQSGRLSQVLEEYVDLQHSQSELRRRVWTALAYPFVLLLFIAVLSAFAGFYVVPSFRKLFWDFGVALPAMTLLAIKGSLPVFWFFATLVVMSIAIPYLLALSPAAGWMWPVLYRLPAVGPLWRWSHLAQFSRLMGLLLDQHVALTDALRVTASGLRDASLARGCRRVASDTEQGRPLDQSLAARRPFPPSLIPIIQWGQSGSALPDAFRAAAEMFEGRVRSQGTILETMLVPIMLFAVLNVVGFYVLAMFLPLIKLIVTLSS